MSYSYILFLSLLLCMHLQKCWSQSECVSINRSLHTEENYVSLVLPDVIVLMPYYRIACEGYISNWEVVATGQHNKSFEITFMVLQPDSEDKQYTLVGKNQLSLTYLENVNVYNLTPSEEDRIYVYPRNIVGFYINSSDSLNKGEYGVRVSPFLGDPPVVTYSYPYSMVNLGLEMHSSLNIDDFRVKQVDAVPLVAAFVVNTANTTNPITPSIPLVTSLSTSSTTSISTTTAETIATSSYPTDPITDSSDDANTLLTIGIPVILVVLAAVIIFITLSIVIIFCIKSRKRRLQKGLDNPIYNTHSKLNNENAYALSMSKNPSYNFQLSIRHPSRQIVSEHFYETCYDPYDYLEPVVLVAKSKDLERSYEIPTLWFNTTSSASSASQPIPVSPGYEVPMDSPISDFSNEEYHQPGWIYRSGSNHLQTVVKHS